MTGPVSTQTCARRVDLREALHPSTEMFARRVDLGDVE
jgi:hypothetical protein